MFEAQLLRVPRLRFSPDDSWQVSSDKLKGLQQYGPYKPVAGTPQFAFVFPRGKAEQANALFRALAKGVDIFKGMPTVFKMPLGKSQVVPITDFSDDQADPATRAASYRDAIRDWLAANNSRPDFFFLLHERTPEWEIPSPYHMCKRLLLEEGIVSQSVTFDLIGSPSQFGWSAANIALATFCKLGGTPWVVDKEATHLELIIGIGRTEIVDPVDRSRKKRSAYTTCIESRGEYVFSTVGRVTEEYEDYLQSLSEAVCDALTKAASSSMSLGQITIYVTKEFSRREMEAVSTGILNANATQSFDVYVLKVTDEPRFFLVDSDSQTGIPPRGVAVELGPQDHLLYTEGADNLKTWKGRTPFALRVRQYPSHPSGLVDQRALNNVLDLSQVNFRGFNAVSRPAVLVYSERTARMLETGANLADKPTLDRMWFL